MDLPSRKWGERNVKLKKKMQIYCTSEEKNSRAEERSLVVVRGLKGGLGRRRKLRQRWGRASGAWSPRRFLLRMRQAASRH